MSSRILWLVLLAITVLLSIGAGSAYWALTDVPEFYSEVIATPVDPVRRKDAAQEFEARTLQLVSDLRDADAWAESFTQQQINSWLAEELQSEKFRDAIPEGVQEPRIRLNDDTIQIGFRFDRDAFHGVVSLELKPWIVEPNRLAIEIVGIQAGRVPIPLDSVLHELTGQIETHGWNVDWKQSDGNDVVIVNLDNGTRNAPVLERLDISPGELSVSGSRRETTSDDNAPVEAPSPSNGHVSPVAPRVARHASRHTE